MGKVLLKDLCTLEKGKQIDTILLDDSNQYKYINGGIKESGFYSLYNTNGETVIVSEGGASCGYVNYINEPFWCGCHCYRLTNIKVKPLYLYYLLKGNQNNIMALRTGAAMPNIKKSTFEKLELNVDFDFQNQCEVINALSNIEGALKIKRTQLESLDELIKSRFIEMFKGHDYPEIALKDLSLAKAEYGAGSASVPYEEGRPRYVRITDINDDGALNDDVVCSINPQDDIDYKLSYGDFMFARMGATVGKTYAFYEGNEIYAGYLIRYKLDTKKINPKYLFTYTKLDEYWLWVKNNQSGAAQPGINAKKYDALTIPVPPIELQNEFASFVEQIDKSKFVYYSKYFL